MIFPDEEFLQGYEKLGFGNVISTMQFHSFTRPNNFQLGDSGVTILLETVGKGDEGMQAFRNNCRRLRKTIDKALPFMKDEKFIRFWKWAKEDYDKNGVTMPVIGKVIEPKPAVIPDVSQCYIVFTSVDRELYTEMHPDYQSAFNSVLEDFKSMKDWKDEGWGEYYEENKTEEGHLLNHDEFGIDARTAWANADDGDNQWDWKIKTVAELYDEMKQDIEEGLIKRGTE